MIDHINLYIRDLVASKAFYTAILAPLGLRFAGDTNEGGDPGTLFGRPGIEPCLWIGTGKTPSSPLHFAFTADSRAEVDAFYDAALKAGAQDNGKPGLRKYHPNYYAAFIFDPDGHNIEAVCHKPK